MVSKNMNKGRLEVRYRDTVLDIRPDWFTIYTEYDGLIESLKYQCEIKDAYPDNMFEFKYSGKDNIWIENDECWLKYLTFNNIYVDDNFQCLIAAYTNDYIEEYLEEHSIWLKQLNIDVKYIK